MLHYAGFTRRIGSVDSGTTVTDYLPQERERGITIGAACITFEWKHHRINLIDTPGHVDFTIEVERSLRVMDGAIAVVDSVAGIEAQTEMVWKQADRWNIPKIAFINKLDRAGAKFSQTIEEISKKFRVKAVPMQMALFQPKEFGEESPPNIQLFDLVKMKRLFWDQNSKGLEYTEMNLESEKADIREAVLAAREKLVEIIAEFDDAIFEEYVENNSALTINADKLKAAIRRLTIERHIVPVFGGSAFWNIGVQPVMDAINDFLPSPIEKSAMIATVRGKEEKISLDSKGKLCALAFKVICDMQKGPMVFLRVYSGKFHGYTNFRHT